MRTLILVIVLFLAACRGAVGGEGDAGTDGDAPPVGVEAGYLESCAPYCERLYHECMDVPAVVCSDNCRVNWDNDYAARSTDCVLAEIDLMNCMTELECSEDATFWCEDEVRARHDCD